MHVTLPDNTKLYYNVNGEEQAINPQQSIMLVLHGGPGLADHSLYVPFWSKLQNIVQVVFIGQRGHGRSDGRDSPSTWSFDQWAQDVYDFCEALSIEKPTVAGILFGGWVAQAYAIKFPSHPSALILCRTEAKIHHEKRKDAYGRKAQRLGQDPEEIKTVVQKIFDWESGEKTRQLYLERCLPLYSVSKYTPTAVVECRPNPDVWDNFGTRQFEFDFRQQLQNISVPAVVVTGEHDPEHPPAFAQELAQALCGELVIIKDACLP
jgi:pimeloyl-ACP methyl ester carboxylesterase